MSDALGIATPVADAPRPATLTQRASLNVIATLLDYGAKVAVGLVVVPILVGGLGRSLYGVWEMRSEEHTSELQSHSDLVCRLRLEKKKFHRARAPQEPLGQALHDHRHPVGHQGRRAARAAGGGGVRRCPQAGHGH